MPPDSTISNHGHRTVAVIPAAGSGVRMGADIPKQFLDMGGAPIIAVTLQAFQNCGLIDGIVVVAPRDSMDFCRYEVVEKFSLSKVLEVVPGGARRQDSVRHGLEATGGEYDFVVIHDAVRPLVSVELIQMAVMEAWKGQAIVTGIPSKDTVKETDDSLYVRRTYDRSHLWLIQTPQVFRYHDLVLGHQKALDEKWEVTDDAALMEKMGIPVRVVMGSERNIKVTTPHDLELMRFFMDKHPSLQA